MFATTSPLLVLMVKLATPVRVRLGLRWNRARVVEAALLCVACTLIIIHGTSLVGDYRIDDAYITFAYSHNLADGRGPIYGHDMKVEGYSNFLWMLLIAVGEILRIDPLSFARFLGHAFFALTLASTWVVARRWAGPIAAVVVTLCLAASSDFHRSVQSGLETVAYCGFIAAGFCHYLLEAPERRKWSILWFSGAALTRIDGFGALGLLLGLEGLRWLATGRKESLVTLVKWAAIGLAPVATYWVWRYSYYGLPFPLTYYAKASLAQEMEYRGATYVWTTVQDTGLWIVALLAAFGLGSRRAKTQFVVVGFIVGMTGYVIHVGGDWMPVNRMLLPVFAPLLMLSATAFAEPLPSWSLVREPHKLATGVVFIAGHAWSAIFMNQALVDTPFEKSKLASAEHIKNHTLGLISAEPFVNAIIRQPGDRLATDYGGVFAYDTEATVIEMWGLANRDIALRGNTDGVSPIYGKTCVPCYAEFQPDYFHSIVPLLRGPKDFRTKHQLIRQIFQGPAIDAVVGLRENYRAGRVIRDETGETLWFVERNRPGVSFEPRRVGEFTVDYPNLR